LIFIDGEHTRKETKNDLKQALKLLSLKGTIVMHDANPWSEETQRMPRETQQWNGDVWKTIIEHVALSDHLVYTVDSDFGICCIHPFAPREQESRGMTDYYPVFEKKQKRIFKFDINRRMVQKNKRYLVTGASGFLGEALIEKLISMGCKINALSRNEGNLIKLHGGRLEIDIFPGDVADDWVVRRAAQGCSGIFHLAAFKHVTMAEQNAIQCISSNVEGSKNVCATAFDYNSIKFVIGISTDKAAQISGVYGAYRA